MGLPRSIFAVLVVFLSLSATLFATQASCTFETFTVPQQYTLSSVQGVADDGTVVGQVIDNKTLLPMGFMRSAAGTVNVFAAPKSSTTWMYDQNATGTTAGSYLDNGPKGKVHGFTLKNGSNFGAVNYPGAPNTWVFGVNHVGALVGSYTSGINVKGFLLVNGQYTSLVSPGQQLTFPMAVNDNNAVVGYAASGFVDYGFLWQNGKFTPINSPKARYGTMLTGINNSGVIVGNNVFADHDTGFIYQNGVFKSIVYSGGRFTLAGGINNNGVISGQIYLNGNGTLGYTAVCK